MILKAELEDKALAEKQKKNAEAAAAKKEEESKPAQRPMTSDADKAKKAKLQVKFDRIKEKVQANKDSAVNSVKNGDYAGAISLYKKAAEILDIAYEDFGVFKKEIA